MCLSSVAGFSGHWPTRKRSQTKTSTAFGKSKFAHVVRKILKRDSDFTINKVKLQNKSCDTSAIKISLSYNIYIINIFILVVSLLFSVRLNVDSPDARSTHPTHCLICYSFIQQEKVSISFSRSFYTCDTSRTELHEVTQGCDAHWTTSFISCFQCVHTLLSLPVSYGWHRCLIIYGTCSCHRKLLWISPFQSILLVNYSHLLSHVVTSVVSLNQRWRSSHCKWQ